MALPGPDEDIVQESDPDVVQDPPQARRGGRRPASETTHPAILLSRSGAGVGGHRHAAVAMLRLHCRVALPEDEVTEERASMRPDGSELVACFFVEYLVADIVPFSAPVNMRWPCTIDDLIAKLRRSSSDAAVAASLAQHRNASFVSCPAGLVEKVLGGSWHLLASIPGASQQECVARAAAADLPPPAKALFREASGRRAASGVVYRKRKRSSAPNLRPTEVKRRILWVRASQYFKNAGKLQEGAECVLDAILNGFDEFEAAMGDDKAINKRQALHYRVRIDAVPALLQRRENHDSSLQVARGMRCDASPKLNAEITMEMESVFYDSSAKVNVVQREYLPGATLVHRLSRLPQKLFVCLWGLFLCFGPTLFQMRHLLRSIRWVVSDFGVESSIADAVDCLPTWAHWAKGLPTEEAPLPNASAFLLPLAVFVPGWNHLFSNIIKDACTSLRHWHDRLQQVRQVVRFLKVTDYRYVWSQSLSRVGLFAAAAEVKQNFEASFAAWRWETIAVAFLEIRMLRWVCESFFDAAVFGKLEDETLLRTVSAAFSDHEFMMWIEILSVPLGIAEEARLWGTWCACHDIHSEAERHAAQACEMKSRRLHQARAYINAVCEKLVAWQSRLTLGDCDNIHAIFEVRLG